jgi:hypothetical protein
VQPTSDLLTAWVGQPDNFVWIEPRGWVDVQATAARYLEDPRRTDDPAEWESSAQRFMQGVASSGRWTSDPTEDEVIDAAEVFADLLPLPIPWENKIAFRSGEPRWRKTA